MTSKECEMACLLCKPRSFVPFWCWVTASGGHSGSRRPDKRHNAAGALLFSGYFAQALEGPRAERTTT